MKKVNIYDVVNAGGFDSGRIIYNEYFRLFADNMNELFSHVTINKKGHLVILDENGKMTLDVNQFIIDSKKPQPGPGPEPEPFPPTPVDEPNTPAQNSTASDIIVELAGGTKTITVPEGESIKNITIPSSIAVAPSITGEIANNAHIVMEAEQILTVNNTSADPIDVHIEMPANKTLTLKGKYNNICVNGKGFSGSNDTIITGVVTIIAPEGTAMTAGGDWTGQECAVYTETAGTLNVTNSNPTGDEKINVYAPNATVTLNNIFDEVTATVSDNTLKLAASFFANKLTVLKGNVLINGIDIKDFCNTFTSKGTVTPVTFDVLTCSPGVSNLNADTQGNGLTFGTFASGKSAWYLNDHTYTMKRNLDTGIVVLRNKVQLNLYGPGAMTSNGAAEHYGLWTASPDNVLNIYGGDYSAYTHCVYAEKGTINIYGGSFKLLNADTVERDVNGLLKFLCNCKDENYTAGTAKITVYGGKFYEFNPAEAYNEPGSPINMVANGYKVVETTEEGKRVFEVVKI